MKQIKENTPILRLDKSQARRAAEVLARAFQDYPLYRYYYPDASQRNKVNRYFSLISVYFGFHFGEVYATQNLEGIAVWLPAAHISLGFSNLLRAVPLSVLFGSGWHAALKMQAADRYIEEIHKRLAPFDHWYLLMFGVEPQFQGRGFGSHLLKSMLLRADKEHLPCYLETNDEVDVSIYQHFGFKVMEEGLSPGTNVKNWAMLREVHPVSQG